MLPEGPPTPRLGGAGENCTLTHFAARRLAKPPPPRSQEIGKTSPLPTHLPVAGALASAGSERAGQSPPAAPALLLALR